MFDLDNIDRLLIFIAIAGAALAIGTVGSHVIDNSTNPTNPPVVVESTDVRSCDLSFNPTDGGEYVIESGVDRTTVAGSPDAPHSLSDPPEFLAGSVRAYPGETVTARQRNGSVVRQWTVRSDCTLDEGSQ